ncbi:hypothetical protein N7535_003264 [Penicillium sp. DV-2018c]|nr:hypothetical protein N7535_003264 [Penicillium sp. DV-2018c]
MPPIRSRSSRKLVEQEGGILLAIRAYNNKQITSIREVAPRFHIPRSTLQDRLSGHAYRVTSRANSHKLTELEEETLRKWIQSLDDRGAAPRPTTVRETANIILEARGTTPVQTVGDQWVYNFVKRSPELSNRAKTQKLSVYGLHSFKTIIENGIDPDDVYNFDETGFAMGLTATAKVVTRSSCYRRRALLQPGNREWVTAIECTNESGWVLPPCVIFKGKKAIESWFDGLSRDCRFEVSPNGWTSDEIGLRWLEKHFIPLTISRTKGRYRLLILDGHGSHLTPRFDKICAENNIIPIPICMPPHSSHLL